jgi:hypothetical protein
LFLSFGCSSVPRRCYIIERRRSPEVFCVSADFPACCHRRIFERGFTDKNTHVTIAIAAGGHGRTRTRANRRRKDRGSRLVARLTHLYVTPLRFQYAFLRLPSYFCVAAVRTDGDVDVLKTCEDVQCAARAEKALRGLAASSWRVLH